MRTGKNGIRRIAALICAAALAASLLPVQVLAVDEARPSSNTTEVTSTTADELSDPIVLNQSDDQESNSEKSTDLQQKSDTAPADNKGDSIEDTKEPVDDTEDLTQDTEALVENTEDPTEDTESSTTDTKKAAEEIAADKMSQELMRNTISVSMDNLLVKTNQAARMSYTIPEGYEEQVVFAVADEADSGKVTISPNSDGIWTITPIYNMNQAGDTLTIYALYGDEVVGSCEICFVPSISSSDGVKYFREDGTSIITASKTWIPFATPTVLYADWDNQKLEATGVEALENAQVSRWEWGTNAPQALDLAVDEEDSSHVTATLCQATSTVYLYAKPWLMIDGTEYLYNYPNYSNNSGNHYIGVAADNTAAAVSCDPSNVYEGTSITLTFNISSVEGVDENTVVTWSCSNPDIVPLEDEHGLTVTVQTQKGYIADQYVGLTVTASAEVNGKIYSGSFNSLWVWKEATSADAQVKTLSELQQAIADGKKTIAVAQTIELPANMQLDISGVRILRSSDLNGPVFSVTEPSVTIVDSTASGSIDGDQRAANAPLISVETDGELTLEAITLENSLNNNGEGGAVSVKDGHLVCNNVTFTNNKARVTTSSNDYKGGGAIYAIGAVVEIFDCTFTDNTAQSGNGGAIYADQDTSGIIQNSKIEGCAAEGTADFGDGKGGGIYCRLTGKVEILNNTIENCQAGDNGGGIAVVVDWSGTAGTERTQVVLDGNIIRTCVAQNRGGGLYLVNSLVEEDPTGQSRETNCIKLLSGTITGCTADWGGGIDYTGHGMNALYLTNVIVRNNAAVRGAGIWACPTSETESYSTLGGAIYGNKAQGVTDGMNPVQASGDDVRYEGEDAAEHREDPLILQSGSWFSETSVMTVMQRALGGGLTQWYADEQAKRYTAGDAAADESLYTATKQSFSLHGELAAPYQQLAERAAKLIVEGNTAESRGGGIATNSQIVIGLENQDKTITVNKVWSGSSTYPDSLDVTLVQIDAEGNQVELETVTLNKDNGWSATFTDLPAFYLSTDGKQCDYSYTVTEEAVAGWSGSTEISQDGLVITLTNTKTSEGGSGDPDPEPTPVPSSTPQTFSNTSTEEKTDVVNTSSIPSTRDASNVGLWVVLCVVSFVGLALLTKKKLDSWNDR